MIYESYEMRILNLTMCVLLCFILNRFIKWIHWLMNLQFE